MKLVFKLTNSNTKFHYFVCLMNKSSRGVFFKIIFYEYFINGMIIILMKRKWRDGVEKQYQNKEGIYNILLLLIGKTVKTCIQYNTNLKRHKTPDNEPTLTKYCFISSRGTHYWAVSQNFMIKYIRKILDISGI